ncbi:MAG TPA: hypothetical protein VGN18_04315 [Jatrophihabitans sp.]|jgi:hypothetical protein|uniref:hypothetical protein n=1 Tax=Jatrophihabitans sp. TaxID=1932789 RepID=UPI002E0C50A7|nr:hypothetical protein [Jatrophihabitans sp.]
MTSSSSVAHRLTARRPVGSGAPIAPRTEVRVSGRVVAWSSAKVVLDPAGDTLDVRIECTGGDQPPWARRLLVHDLLNRAQHAGISRVTLACPLGDVEIIDALNDHCQPVVARSAGTTCIVEADLKAPLRRDHAN